MNKLLARLWIRLKYGRPLTSLALLHMTLDSTQKISKHGTPQQLAEWCKDYLLPRLDDVREWAEEVIRDNETH